MSIPMENAKFAKQTVVFSDGTTAVVDDSGALDVPESDYLTFLKMNFKDTRTQDT